MSFLLLLLLFRLMLGVCEAGAGAGTGAGVEWGGRRWRGTHGDVEEEAQRAQVRYAVEPHRVRDEREERELILFSFSSSFLPLPLVVVVPGSFTGRYWRM
jgi:hypothetical protein